MKKIKAIMPAITEFLRQYALSSIFLLVILITVAGTSWARARRFDKLEYLELLNKRAVTIDNAEYQFRDLAFYLAHQEQAAWEQAKAYDLEHPKNTGICVEKAAPLSARQPEIWLWI